jgi:hypothetical protein
MRYRLRHPFHYSNSPCERVIRLKTDTPLIQWVDDEGGGVDEQPFAGRKLRGSKSSVGHIDSAVTKRGLFRS